MKISNPISDYSQLLAELNAHNDGGYKNFNNKIINSEYPSIGVRTPVMRDIAKRVPLDKRDGILNAFFAETEHCFETVTVAGLIAAKKGDYEKTRDHMKRIIPLFGSWAHVDTVIPSLKWADRRTLLSDFEYLLNCDGQYEIRSYVIMLFDCLTDEYIDFVLDKIEKIPTGAYYVDMGLAWLIAECLVKYYGKTLPIIEKKTMPVFIHNKAIQKARESFRVSAEDKAYLNTLKIK